MAAKILLIACASALLVQSALGACFGRIGAGIGPYAAGFDGLGYAGLGCNGIGFGGFGYSGLGFGYGGLGYDGFGCGGLEAAYGGGLGVSSASPMAPTGLGVASENVYEGVLAVGGNLPFLGTVAVDGLFDTAGAGAVSYGCGDGAVGITAEGPIGAGVGPAYGYGAGIGYGLGFGYGLGYAGARGCGCGAFY